MMNILIFSLHDYSMMIIIKKFHFSHVYMAHFWKQKISLNDNYGKFHFNYSVRIFFDYIFAQQNTFGDQFCFFVVIIFFRKKVVKIIIFFSLFRQRVCLTSTKSSLKLANVNFRKVYSRRANCGQGRLSYIITVSRYIQRNILQACNLVCYSKYICEIKKLLRASIL